MQDRFFLVKTEHFTNIFLSLQTKVVKYSFVNLTFVTPQIAFMTFI